MWLKKDYNSETQVQLTCILFEKKENLYLIVMMWKFDCGVNSQDKRLQKGPTSEILKKYIFQKWQEIHFS